MACALISNSKPHFLDHISPLASLLEIPLILSDEKNVELATKYYPEVPLRYWPDLAFRLKEIGEEFDTLFECNYWIPQFKDSLKFYTQKNIRLIFCPHGQSDKGYQAPLLAQYALQEIILIYGSLMKKMLEELHIWPSISRSIEVGNFRFNYYQKHRERLLKIVDTEIFSHLEKQNRTLLYAPTWEDEDLAGTFFQCGDRLLKELPSDWNLIIKIHPLIKERHPALFYRLSIIEEKRSNFFFIDQFPPIYPILERMDVYLGDYSSIGYDVLAFQKPMFFISQPHLLPARLHSAGAFLDRSKNLFQQIEKHLPNANQFKKTQSELYHKAFTPIKNIREVIP